MFTHRRHKTAGRALLLAIGLTVAGCQDLNVENLISPDRRRATANATDVEAFIGGAFFPSFWAAIHGNGTIATHFPNAASEFTMTGAGQGTLLWWEDLREPRRRHDNGALISVGNGPHGPRLFWSNVGRTNSIAHDGLRILDEGMTIMNGNLDVTPRAMAYARFMQGWAWGYQAITFDRIHVVPDSIDLPSDPNALKDLAIETLVPWEEGLEAALNAIDEAIAIAEQHPLVVNFPSFSESALWFASDAPISNATFIEMANTLAARLIVLSARSPAERATLDWGRVLAYTARGMTSDYRVTLASGNRASQLLARTQSNLATGTTNARVDYRVIGLADQSGAYQEWIAKTPAERDRFNIVTPDRRVTGPTPTSDGAYVRYRADNNGFEPDRGLYLFSAYQWARHAIDHGLTGSNTGNAAGSFPLITAAENDLLRAEALLRTGDKAGAAALINITRTRSHTIGGVTYPGLPAVTVAGVPEVDGVCVPRIDSGACGDLLTAVRYERMLELLATDNIRGYADSRGWGTLPDGAILSWPVPGDALQLYEMEGYSYGGVGEPNTAYYEPEILF
jgi:hypothetical protein